VLLEELCEQIHERFGQFARHSNDTGACKVVFLLLIDPASGFCVSCIFLDAKPDLVTCVRRPSHLARRRHKSFAELERATTRCDVFPKGSELLLAFLIGGAVVAKLVGCHPMSLVARMRSLIVGKMNMPVPIVEHFKSLPARIRGEQGF
jgi:hypothetical protein